MYYKDFFFDQQKTCTDVLDPLVRPYSQKVDADTCACEGVRLLGPRAWRLSGDTGLHVRLLMFRTSKDGRITKNLSLSGSLQLVVKTWRLKRGRNSQDNRHVRQQRETLKCDAGGNFGRTQRSPAPFIRRSAMHRSKLHIRSVDAGAGRMSIISSSGGGGASGMSASSSSSTYSARAHSTRSSGAGSGSHGHGVPHPPRF